MLSQFSDFLHHYYFSPLIPRTWTIPSLEDFSEPSQLIFYQPSDWDVNHQRFKPAEIHSWTPWTSNMPFSTYLFFRACASLHSLLLQHILQVADAHLSIPLTKENQWFYYFLCYIFLLRFPFAVQPGIVDNSYH